MPSPTTPALRSSSRARRRTARTLRLVAVVAAAALTAVACGDQDDTADLIDDTVDTVEESEDERDGIADALRDNGLETLATAVEAADFDQVLGGEFTFFAPTDDAFLSLGADRTADLLSDPEVLLTVLESHVADETLTAADLTAADSITTRTGANFAVDSSDGVMIGEATVVEADIAVGDGVIHLIDAVLQP